MIKKFENFEDERLDIDTLIQILEQIDDEIDYINVVLFSAGGYGQRLEHWKDYDSSRSHKRNFRFYIDDDDDGDDPDLNWSIRLNSDIRSLQQYVNILNVMSKILLHIENFGWKLSELKSTKGNIHHRESLFTSIHFKFKKV